MKDTVLHPETPGIVTLDMRGKAFSTVMQEAEREFFSHVLTEAGGNKSKAARLSGLTKDTFFRRVALFKLKTVFRCE